MNSMRLNVFNEMIDTWIAECELPGRADIKPIRQFDDIRPSESEAEAYWDFISWFLGRDYELLKLIPKPVERDFWISEFEDSAFNTVDFQRNKPRFNKYHFKLKMIYERVKDLAITYSCLSNNEGKRSILNRYRNLVETEFRVRAVMLADYFKRHSGIVDKCKCLERIAHLNQKIKKCNEIWREFAYWD